MTHTHISAGHRLFDLKLRELWRYRDLCFLFVRRYFLVTYNQTILGPAWILLTPLMTAVMHMLVFGNIAGLGTDGLPSLLFYFTCTALWSFFSTCLTKNATVFTDNAFLFGKVYFPRLTVPLAHLLSGFLRFGIEFALILVLLVFYLFRGSVMPRFDLLWVLPLCLLELGLAGLGLGLLLSACTAKYRDLSHLVGFGVTLLMYGTPVAYPYSELSEGVLRTLIRLNPLTAPMELFRLALLGKGAPLFAEWILSWILVLLCLFAGIIVFHKVERTFLDTV